MIGIINKSDKYIINNYKHMWKKDIMPKLRNSLLALRLWVALVLIMWTVDKIINAQHATAVFSKFYFIPLPENIMIFVGIAQLVLVALFLIGRFKNITYLIVLIIHWVSTLSPMVKYFTPYEGSNLLFFAAWPMLAACYTLYILRHEDTKFNF